MNEFIEKLIGRLEEYKYSHLIERDSEMLEHCKEKEMDCEGSDCFLCVWDKATEIVNQLAEEYNNDGWIPCSKQLPTHSDDLLLIQCSGKPKNNIVFDNAFCLASYTKEGWLLELYPEWKGAEVIAWMPLPEPFKPIAE